VLKSRCQAFLFVFSLVWFTFANDHLPWLSGLPLQKRIAGRNAQMIATDVALFIFWLPFKTDYSLCSFFNRYSMVLYIKIWGFVAAWFIQK